jgi:hypothetical protein
LIEVVVVLVALPALIALIVSIVSRRGRAQGQPPRINIMSSLNSSHAPWSAEAAGAARTMPDDWRVLATLCSSVPTLGITWLRTNTFVTPWLHANAREALDLEPLAAAARERPFPYQIDEALRRLGDAIAAFRDVYERSTYPDPVLPGAEWRFFEWDNALSFQASPPGETPWDDRAAEMHGLALAVADAYENLQTAAASDLRAFSSAPART